MAILETRCLRSCRLVFQVAEDSASLGVSRLLEGKWGKAFTPISNGAWEVRCIDRGARAWQQLPHVLWHRPRVILHEVLILFIFQEDSSTLSHLLEALECGCPPHGGIALGEYFLYFSMWNWRSMLNFQLAYVNGDGFADKKECLEFMFDLLWIRKNHRSNHSFEAIPNYTYLYLSPQALIAWCPSSVVRRVYVM